MNTGNRYTFSFVGILVLLALVTAVWPSRGATTHETDHGQATAQTQSVSGKIAAVGKNSFTLTVGSAMSNPGHQFQEADAKTMEFMIDKNTTIDGKLKVGANADVTYREENGKNLAINVRVAS